MNEKFKKFDVLDERMVQMLSGIERLIYGNEKLNGNIKELVQPLTDLASITREEYTELKKRKRPTWYS